jgi:hypothetical protein
VWHMESLVRARARIPPAVPHTALHLHVYHTHIHIHRHFHSLSLSMCPSICMQALLPVASLFTPEEEAMSQAMIGYWTGHASGMSPVAHPPLQRTIHTQREREGQTQISTQRHVCTDTCLMRVFV